MDPSCPTHLQFITNRKVSDVVVVRQWNFSMVKKKICMGQWTDEVSTKCKATTSMEGKRPCESNLTGSHKGFFQRSSVKLDPRTKEKTGREAPRNTDGTNQWGHGGQNVPTPRHYFVFHTFHSLTKWVSKHHFFASQYRYTWMLARSFTYHTRKANEIQKIRINPNNWTRTDWGDNHLLIREPTDLIEDWWKKKPCLIGSLVRCSLRDSRPSKGIK